MKKYRNLFGKVYPLPIIIAISSLAWLCITVLSSSHTILKQEANFEERQRQKKEKIRNVDLPLKNLTQGLAIIKVEKDVDHDLVRVILRNDYQKIVTAYKVAVGS